MARIPEYSVDQTRIGPPKLTDAAAYAAAEDDALRRTLMLDHPTTVAEARKRLKIALQHWANDLPDWRFAIRAVGQPELIGWICIRLAPSGYTIEYWLASDHRGQGHAKRAVELATHFAFCERGLPSLRAEIVDPNEASVAVVMSQGFWPTPQTCLIRSPTGRTEIADVYFITKRRWQKTHRCQGD